VPFTAMHGSVRFSLSRYSTAAEVDVIAAAFPKIVARLRHASPYWDHAHNRPAADIPQPAAGPSHL
jgi:cysteine desulfurase